MSPSANAMELGLESENVFYISTFCSHHQNISVGVNIEGCDLRGDCIQRRGFYLQL